MSEDTTKVGESTPPISGEVDGVSFTPGRDDGLMMIAEAWRGK